MALVVTLVINKVVGELKMKSIPITIIKVFLQ